MASASADPPGYFVGRPLHYQEKQPQTDAEPQAVPRQPAAVDDQNAVNAQVPGYYKGRVQPRRSDDSHVTGNNAIPFQQNRESSFLAKFFSCFSRSS